MSGGNIAYHLRPNKAVERTLFIDLLNRLARNSFNISDYQYVGFGGPFMEDFKAIHTATRISKMICIERDQTVQARQMFNCPLSCVDFVLKNSSDFVDDFSADMPNVVWLDFTSPGELKQQLDDTSNLVKKLAHGDVFKVTLNASVSALREESSAVNQVELVKLRRSVFENRTGTDLPANLTDNDFKADQYPRTLLRATKLAAERGVNHSGLVIQPLTAFSYSDGTTMLTATGIVLDPRQIHVERFPEVSRLTHWPFANLTWSHPLSIDLPVLSARERMTLETLQPNGTVGQAIQKLGAMVGNAGITQAAIASYGRYYRVYPEFARIST